MSKWNYGDSYRRYPLTNEPYVFEDGSIIKVHNIFDELPDFMMEADLIFVDPPWNLGNLNTFYTKAEMEERVDSFEKFYLRLFECIKTISPGVCYVEVGKEYLPDFILERRKIYKYATF